MGKTLVYATLFSATVLGSGALAQTAEAPNAMNPPAQAKSDQPAQAKSDQTSTTDAQPAANSQAPAGMTFVTTQPVTQWRAPKLVGVAVYGPDEKQIGKIKDVLIDHNGAAQAVVIGVGGFLGFGEKDVAVPFASIQWRTEPRKVPSDQPPTNPVASTSGQTAGPPPMKETDPAATEASQGYPDKAILGVTVADLKSAPDFHYAASPQADVDARSTGSSEPKRSGAP
jgi:sporulation protein YlmC with PRC-barrel domain